MTEIATPIFAWMLNIFIVCSMWQRHHGESNTNVHFKKKRKKLCDEHSCQYWKCEQHKKREGALNEKINLSNTIVFHLFPWIGFIRNILYPKRVKACSKSFELLTCPSPIKTLSCTIFQNLMKIGVYKYFNLRSFRSHGSTISTLGVTLD